MKKANLVAAAAISAVLAGSATSAAAADLGPYPPPGASYKDDYAPAASAFSWRGFYFGVNAGYGWGADDRVGLGSAVDGDFWSKFDNSGGFGGGQFGYNGQLGNWVLGIEGDIQGAGIGDTRTGTAAGGFAAAVKNEIDFFGTVRGRLGYATGPMLFYATGGFAWAHMDGSAIGTTSTGNAFALSGSGTQTGYTIGAGVEYAFARNWTMKLEYQYLDLEAFRLTGVDSGGSAVSSTIDPSFHTVRAGLNFRF